jgi:uncharacterized protein YjbJ (UPF0337 family)
VVITTGRATNELTGTQPFNPAIEHREGVFMDKERIKGKAEDVAGRVQRQVGEWTGDEKAQAEGLAKQAEGKVRNAVGKVKDSIRDAADESEQDRIKREEKDRIIVDRDKDVA